jgi:hypothetical protein
MVAIMENSMGTDRKVMVEIVDAAGTRIKVWIESGTTTVVVVADAINIMVV